MNWKDFIRTLGPDEPISLLDPERYPEEEIEEDLVNIDMNKQEARNMVEQKKEEYEAKLDEATEAPEWKKEDLLLKAEMIERDKEDWHKRYHMQYNQKCLIKSIQSFRRRVNDSEQTLDIDQLHGNESNKKICSMLRKSLNDHMRSQQQVDELMKLFTNNSDLDLFTILEYQRDDDRSGSESRSQVLEKQRKRLEEQKNSSSQTATGDGCDDWSTLLENCHSDN